MVSGLGLALLDFLARSCWILLLPIGYHPPLPPFGWFWWLGPRPSLCSQFSRPPFSRFTSTFYPFFFFASLLIRFSLKYFIRCDDAACCWTSVSGDKACGGLEKFRGGRR